MLWYRSLTKDDTPMLTYQMEFKAIWFGGTEEIKRNLFYDSQSPSQDLNLQQLKYKRVLTALSVFGH